MKHIKDGNIRIDEPTVVTIGNFDGCHIGHRELISKTKELANEKNMKSVVFTFNPHPMFLFNNRNLKALIMSYAEKKHTIENIGIDVYVEVPFDKGFSELSPEEFIDEIIIKRLNCKAIVVGENYRFGKCAKGDAELLIKMGKSRGLDIILIPDIYYEGSRVSSTRIRKCLTEKNIEEANRLLVEPYFIFGEVIYGKKLGRTIGFPTINIEASKEKLFPPNGVYATRTLHNGKIYSGVTNVGINPTVNGSKKIVETYLFDFSKFVYGEEIKTYLFKWIRQERKFESVDALKAQMVKDSMTASKYFITEEFKYWAKNF